MFRPRKPDIKGMFGEDPGQNTVVIQCRHDREHMFTRASIKNRKGDVGNGTNPDYLIYHTCATLDEAASRIDSRDLVFTYGKGTNQRGNILDNAIPVLSNLNGAYVRTDGMTPADIADAKEDFVNERIADNIRLVGVALGATNPATDDEGLRKEQITVRTQGTVDVFNNGTSNFVPGDVVLWEVPSKRDVEQFSKRYGWSESKVPLKLIPLRHAQKAYSAADSVSRICDIDNPPEPGEGFTPMDELSKSLVQLMIFPILATHALIAEDLSMGLVNEYLKHVLQKPGQQVAVNPAHAVHADVVELLRDVVNEARENRVFGQVCNDAMMKFFNVQEQIRRRTVGTSLQYGKPGQKFTVLLNQT